MAACSSTGRARSTAIREHKDATEVERATRLCNAGLMALSGAHALELLAAVEASNAQKEFYLTDVVGDRPREGLATPTA